MHWLQQNLMMNLKLKPEIRRLWPKGSCYCNKFKLYRFMIWMILQISMQHLILILTENTRLQLSHIKQGQVVQRGRPKQDISNKGTCHKCDWIVYVDAIKLNHSTTQTMEAKVHKQHLTSYYIHTLYLTFYFVYHFP